MPQNLQEPFFFLSFWWYKSVADLQLFSEFSPKFATELGVIAKMEVELIFLNLEKREK